MRGLAMDPSIRLAAILGEYGVDARELLPVERVALFKRLLDECRAQFKYLPCFRPIGDELNRAVEGRNDFRQFRETDPRIVKFPPDFDLGTRCADLGRFFMETHFEAGRYVGAYRNLLLTQKGIPVEWTHWYLFQHRDFTGEQFHKSGDYDVALTSRFSYPDDARLEEILAPQTLKNCIGKLAEFIRDAIIERERRLQSMRELETMVCVVNGFLRSW